MFYVRSIKLVLDSSGRQRNIAWKPIIRIKRLDQWNGKNWDSPKVKIVTAEEDEYNVNDKARVISRVEGITSGVLRNGLPVIVLAVRNTVAKKGIIYYSLDGGETFTRINNYTNLEGSRVDSEGKPLV